MSLSELIFGSHLTSNNMSSRMQVSLLICIVGAIVRLLELHRISFGFIGILLFFSGERSRLLNSTFSQINEWRVHLNLHAIFILFSVVAKALLWLILTFFWRIDLQRRTPTTYNDERFIPMTTIAPA